MIVVSIESDPNHEWRSEGTIFAVQEIGVDLHKGVSLRIEDPADRTPVLAPGSSFEVLDGQVPANWVTIGFTSQTFYFGPSDWQERGFWERYFDDDPTALATYEEFRTAVAD